MPPCERDERVGREGGLESTRFDDPYITSTHELFSAP